MFLKIFLLQIFQNLKINREKFSIFFIFIHLFFIFLPLLNICFFLMTFYEFIFYIIINRLNFKKILRILFFIFFIFILNTIFIDGRILFKILNFYITYEGFINALKKSSIFLNLFFFTSNIFYFKDNFFDIIPENNLFFDSMLYFNEFLKLLNKKFSFKSFFLNIVRIYKKSDFQKDIIKEKKNTTILFVYNILIIPFLMTIFVLKNQLNNLLNF